jgi:hypothetical protein
MDHTQPRPAPGSPCPVPAPPSCPPSPLPALRYAATCQTVGMNAGYFISFTVFLALSDPGFANRHLRTQPADAGARAAGRGGGGGEAGAASIGVALLFAAPRGALRRAVLSM